MRLSVEAAAPRAMFPKRNSGLSAALVEMVVGPVATRLKPMSWPLRAPGAQGASPGRPGHPY
jgi:hypothetical protein